MANYNKSQPLQENEPAWSDKGTTFTGFYSLRKLYDIVPPVKIYVKVNIVWFYSVSFSAFPSECILLQKNIVLKSNKDMAMKLGKIIQCM